MPSDVVRRAIGTLATGAITAHLVSSVLQNTPDTFNQDLSKFVGGWPVPGWRFFAPNPGKQNVHLLVRTASVGSTEASPWHDVTPRTSHGLLQVVWNPASRGPKALFDAMQQLSAMGSNYVRFNWVVRSQPYELVASAARRAAADDTSRLQFLLVNRVPSAEVERQMVPVLVSEWLAPRDRIDGP